MLQFCFVRLFGKLTVVELSEEISQGQRVYVAAMSEDPSVYVKAPDVTQAVSGLVGHIQRSPTIRRLFYEPPAALPAQEARRPRVVQRYMQPSS